ncbi:MAG: amidohydrolase [Desulfobacteraceae bacterium]|nr:amidohydrolase [Desulfobacteraceae bacterium]
MENTALNYLEANQDKLNRLAGEIWARPEIALKEEFASRQIALHLEQAGFSITKNIGQMPTAFVAQWGQGKPIIGILGEYDALPGLSQKVSPDKEPMEENGPGHGCGHNLLGVASLGAALAVKEAMAQHQLKGTIRYYGCPAEETLVGKVYMARAGVFHDLDAAITWHPGYLNTVSNVSLAALNSFKVNFHGVSTHAGATPQLGRSALKGVELMDIGVNYLREHISSKARIHSVIPHGGKAPNVVPDYAQIWYYVRAPKRKQVDAIYSWMLDIAKGAALMTQTTYDIEFLTGGHDVLPNKTIGQVFHEKMKQVGPPQWSSEEMEFAQKLQSNFPKDAVQKSLQYFRMTAEEIGAPFCKIIKEPSDEVITVGGSSDVGDVSYITPTAQISTCCQVLGASSHSWEVVATSGSGIGFKGMIMAAKVMALAALELETKPELLVKAREEFEKATQGKTYVSPLPEDAVPL